MPTVGRPGRGEGQRPRASMTLPQHASHRCVSASTAADTALLPPRQGSQHRHRIACPLFPSTDAPRSPRPVTLLSVGTLPDDRLDVGVINERWPAVGDWSAAFDGPVADRLVDGSLMVTIEVLNQIRNQISQPANVMSSTGRQ